MEERSSFGRWLLFGAIGVALFFFGRKYLFGSGDAPTTQPLGKEIARSPRPARCPTTAPR
jgi:hypothetical protein